MTMTYGSTEYWKAVADIAADDRIYEGIRVRVDGGRKRKGREGIVTRVIQSKYEDRARYKSGASLDLFYLRQREGFCCAGTSRRLRPAQWYPRRFLGQVRVPDSGWSRVEVE